MSEFLFSEVPDGDGTINPVWSIRKIRNAGSRDPAYSAREEGGGDGPSDSAALSEGFPGGWVCSRRSASLHAGLYFPIRFAD